MRLLRRSAPRKDRKGRNSKVSSTVFPAERNLLIRGSDPFWNRFYAMNTKFITRPYKKIILYSISFPVLDMLRVT